LAQHGPFGQHSAPSAQQLDLADFSQHEPQHAPSGQQPCGHGPPSQQGPGQQPYGQAETAGVASGCVTSGVAFEPLNAQTAPAASRRAVQMANKIFMNIPQKAFGRNYERSISREHVARG